MSTTIDHKMQGNFLDTTAGSTHATNIAVTLYMPPAEAARTLAYFDRLQALEAKQPNSAHARACRTNAIEALVLAALDNADLLTRVVAATRRNKIGLVIKHLRKHKDDRYNIEKPPCHKTVKAILQKHGYL